MRGLALAILLGASVAHAQAIVPWDCASQDDDTGTLKSAIAAVHANPGQGGIVRVPLTINDACKVSECIDLKSAYLEGYGPRLSKIHYYGPAACTAMFTRSPGAPGGSSFFRFKGMALYAGGTIPQRILDLPDVPFDTHVEISDLQMQGCGVDCIRLKQPLNAEIGPRIRCDGIGSGYCVRALIPSVSNKGWLHLHGGTTTTRGGLPGLVQQPKGVLGLDWVGQAPSDAGVVEVSDWSVELNDPFSTSWGLVTIESSGSGTVDPVGILLRNVTAKDDSGNGGNPNDCLIRVDSPVPIDLRYQLINVRTGGIGGTGCGNFSLASGQHPLPGKILYASNAPAWFGSVSVSPGNNGVPGLQYKVPSEANPRWFFDYRSWRLNTGIPQVIYGSFGSGQANVNGNLSSPLGIAPLNGTASQLPTNTAVGFGATYTILDAQVGNNFCNAMNGGGPCRLVCINNNVWKPISPQICN